MLSIILSRGKNGPHPTDRCDNRSITPCISGIGHQNTLVNLLLFGFLLRRIRKDSCHRFLNNLQVSSSAFASGQSGQVWV